jgi:hypothetical protein
VCWWSVRGAFAQFCAPFLVRATPTKGLKTVRTGPQQLHPQHSARAQTTHGCAYDTRRPEIIIIMETSTTPLRSFLDATTLADMEELQQQELVSLCATDTIETGFQVPPRQLASGRQRGVIDACRVVWRVACRVVSLCADAGEEGGAGCAGQGRGHGRVHRPGGHQGLCGLRAAHLRPGPGLGERPRPPAGPPRAEHPQYPRPTSSFLRCCCGC